MVLYLVFIFFNLLLPKRDFLLLIRAAIGTMAMLSAHEAQTFCHAFCVFFFVKTIYVYCVVILLLLLILRAIVTVAIGVGKGDSSVSVIDVAINLSDCSNDLSKSVGISPIIWMARRRGLFNPKLNIWIRTWDSLTLATATSEWNLAM
jgi:hypothetical protein